MPVFTGTRAPLDVVLSSLKEGVLLSDSRRRIASPQPSMWRLSFVLVAVAPEASSADEPSASFGHLAQPVFEAG